MNKDVNEVYQMDKRINRIIERISESKDISNRDKTILLKYKEQLILDGLSLSRVHKYLYELYGFSSWLKKDFEKAKKEDIRRVVSWIESNQKFSDWYKYGLKICIRKFYKWLRKTKKYPKEVAWIKAYMKSHNNKLPEELLTEDDVKNLINASRDTKHKAFVAVLYESGCRIGEVSTLRIKNVSFDQYGAILNVNGKTGYRRVRIVSAVPYLAEWINKHPFKDNPEAWVWINRTQDVIKYTFLTDLLRRLARKAGIKKPVNPHNFRHSRATYLANHLTEAQMKEMFGWVRDSEMASVYVHLSGRDVDKALLKTYGIDINNGQEEESKLKPKDCARCNEKNPATNKFCLRCGMPLEKETIVEIIEKDLERKDADQILDKLLQDDEFKQVFISKMKGMLK